MTEWISVKDKLPQDEWGILVWNGKNITLGCCFVSPDGKKELMSQTAGGKITHWMPLPNPPN